jgi:acyl-CoA-binding protein
MEFPEYADAIKSLRGKPWSIMFLGFYSLLWQQAAGN